MKIREFLTRRGMAGFGMAALAAGALVSVPSAANALPQFQVDKVVDFGVVPVGESRERTLTVTNTGNPVVVEDTANFFQAFAPTPSPPFEFVSTTCPQFPAPFAGGQSCTFTFRFTPTDTAQAVQPALLILSYFQDTDPGPGQNLQAVQKQVPTQLVGNVTCAGRAPTMFGTLGNDVITGTSGNDVIAALDGEDVVTSDGGNDVVCGGFGADVLKGGSGRDKLYGESAGDVLKGGRGTDTCVGGTGLDRAKKCEKVASL